ncbi:MAG TPA: carboxyl transferase domain-containing protein [Capillimicrobium sp.]|nr:carboxyl transferase domain-containing protein [Capillimicrobium sp.]
MTPRATTAPAAERTTLQPLERIALLCDEGSLRPLSAPTPLRPIGVVAAEGRLGGRRVVCYAQDSSIAGGSVGTAEADTVVRALRHAHDHAIPIVAFLESAGARLQEGAAALGGFGRIFYENVRLSTRAPQISVITGTSAGGGCYSPALTDFVVMTRPAAMFLTGPKVVRDAVGEEISMEALGGPSVHNRNGVCHFVADDDGAAIELVRDLLGHLTGRSTTFEDGPAQLHAPDPARRLPAASRSVYDVRDVARDVLDGGRFLEVAARWARNIVVGFGRLGGRPVGVVANQPRHLGGVIDVAASEKGAGFVRTCDRFRLPLVVLVDTPGFMPGSGQEAAGIIRHGAELVRAFAAATVPRFTVILRKAYGGAYITMNSKDLGADLSLAWPGAEIGIMSPHAAVQILHRRRLAEADDRDRLAAELVDEYQSRHIAVERARDCGLIDGVIEPAATRARLREALAVTR